MRKNIYLSPITEVMLLANNDLMYTELTSKGMDIIESTPGLAPGRNLYV